jgi:hypothetical protein
MCQAKPGPRCSAHQKQNFKSALDKMTAIRSSTNSELKEGQREETIRNFANNLAELNATPIGQRLLRTRLLQTTNDFDKKSIRRQMTFGKQLREARLEAAKNGGEAIETPPFKVTAINMNSILNSYDWYSNQFEAEEQIAKNNNQQEKSVAQQNEEERLAEKAAKGLALRRRREQEKISKQQAEDRRNNRALQRYVESSVSDIRYLNNTNNGVIAQMNPSEPLWKNRAATRIKMAKKLPPEVLEVAGPRIRKLIEEAAERESKIEEYQKTFNTPPVADRLSNLFARLGSKLPNRVQEF